MRGTARRLLLRGGVTLVIVGFAPLAAYAVFDWVAGDPDDPGNPVGLGLWSACVGWPGLLCLLVALALGGRAPNSPPPPGGSSS